MPSGEPGHNVVGCTAARGGLCLVGLALGPHVAGQPSGGEIMAMKLGCVSPVTAAPSGDALRFICLHITCVGADPFSLPLKPNLDHRLTTYKSRFVPP
jgi:hypothetical protein